MPKTSLNVELEYGDDIPGAPVTLEERSYDTSQVWRFEPARLEIEESGGEIISTTTTMTVTKVKVITRIKKEV
jgi:hypothetical protein